MGFVAFTVATIIGVLPLLVMYCYIGSVAESISSAFSGGDGGVERVHIISHKLSDSLLLEVFTNEGTGTLVVENINTLSAEEQAQGKLSQAEKAQGANQ